jgi:hypothetical protein
MRAIRALDVDVWGSPMFTVKWVARSDETEPIESDISTYQQLSMVVSKSIIRLEAVRLRRPKSPPDGFIVCDNRTGEELHRWFGSTGR